MADDEEEVWDSWEDAVDSGALDKKLEELPKKQEETNADTVNNTPAMLIEEDSTRTAYQPQLKILKRPGIQNDQNTNKTETEKQATRKSLEQREKEYAEARIRIFGTTEDEERPKALIQDVPAADNSVIRQPKGPDGTTGFNLQR
ncbi:SUZ RNA-binding domain-containing-like isoform X2 [Saccoglossus kowalevskii]|uniref:SUZ RNA-binding domain-containing n=1 Tax=Saccoglossus kowalevskii TaxID=10224 RepID=A0ABM0GJE3_SACKO|nr:PREDICTED: SUZ domain-containing protein 1-like isoform X1 [Saccoglossus kowalevskii]